MNYDEGIDCQILKEAKRDQVPVDEDASIRQRLDLELAHRRVVLDEGVLLHAAALMVRVEGGVHAADRAAEDALVDGIRRRRGHRDIRCIVWEGSRGSQGVGCGVVV